jgi:hypothetical protein
MTSSLAESGPAGADARAGGVITTNLVSQQPGAVQEDAMSRLRATNLVIAVITALWILTAALGAAALVVVNIYFATAVGPSYFPGDPPIADVVLECGAAVVAYAAMGLVVAFVAGHYANTPLLRYVRMVGSGGLVLAVVGLAPVAAEVGKRQFGEWAELKSILGQNEAIVHQLVGREGGQLSEAEYEKARAWFQQNPVYFQFRELPQPTRVRMMTSLAPYVGVDFGDGQNAVFDPETMVCTYAD